MEIKSRPGDKINIPANCKAIIEDGLITIEEKQGEIQEEFKDGDILISKSTNNIVIFKNYSERKPEKFASYWNDYTDDNDEWACVAFRHVTEEERQKFFDELNKKGLRWNVETKEMEKIRKRAKKDENYLFITGRGEIVEYTEDNDYDDNESYNLGNYYLLSERVQAEVDAKKVRAIFQERLKAQ